MEETEVSIEFIKACALHPDTWSRWTPDEIIEKVPQDLPFDQKVMISALPNGVWVILDTHDNILFSSAPIKIIMEDEKSANRTDILTALLGVFITPKS